MRWFAVFFLLLTGCGGGYTYRDDVGISAIGVRYYSSANLGGAELLIYPSGKIDWHYVGGMRESYRESVIVFEPAVWQQIEAIVANSSGKEVVEDDRSDDALCDAGQWTLSAKTSSGTAFFDSNRLDCETWIIRSDRAGREILDIVTDLESRLRPG